MNNKTLLIIPCCKTKALEGNELPTAYTDPLIELIYADQYSSIQKVRKELYSHLKNNLFMTAIDRYMGNLYQANPNLSNCIKEQTNGKDQPKLIILSALYGPLHPEAMINDYELKMSNTKSSQWYINFPSFLKCYVIKNNITEIRIYCGKSTGYYNVLANAIKPLLQKKILFSAMLYNVKGGNAYHTPHNHGLQLFTDLSCSDNKVNFTRTITPEYI